MKAKPFGWRQCRVRCRSPLPLPAEVWVPAIPSSFACGGLSPCHPLFLCLLRSESLPSHLPLPAELRVPAIPSSFACCGLSPCHPLFLCPLRSESLPSPLPLTAEIWVPAIPSAFARWDLSPCHPLFLWPRRSESLPSSLPLPAEIWVPASNSPSFMVLLYGMGKGRGVRGGGDRVPVSPSALTRKDWRDHQPLPEQQC